MNNERKIGNRKTYITMCRKNGKINLHKDVYQMLGMPEYVSFSVDVDNKRMIVSSSTEQTYSAIKVKKHKAHGMLYIVSLKSMVILLYSLCGLDADKTYRVPGNYEEKVAGFVAELTMAEEGSPN